MTDEELIIAYGYAMHAKDKAIENALERVRQTEARMNEVRAECERLKQKLARAERGFDKAREEFAHLRQERDEARAELEARRESDRAVAAVLSANPHTRAGQTHAEAIQTILEDIRIERESDLADLRRLQAAYDLLYAEAAALSRQLAEAQALMRPQAEWGQEIERIKQAANDACQSVYEEWRAGAEFENMPLAIAARMVRRWMGLDDDPVEPMLARIARLRQAWDKLCDCVNEFEPEDMSACGEYRDMLDSAIVGVIGEEQDE